MRILLYGKNGQVGWELQRALAPLGEVIAVDRPEVDFTDLKGLREFTLEVKPDLIVNAAAYTAVDKAESEPDLAMRVNGEAPGVLAEVALKLNAGLVHYSTDYVFDGTKGKPYTEDDEPNPLNVYGKTKLAGDLAIQASGCTHLILRTSWVYGARGSNFFLTILRLAEEGKEIRVVDDQIGCPTWSYTVADATADILRAVAAKLPNSMRLHLHEQMGVYNYCSSGNCSWYEFACVILENARNNQRVRLAEIEAISTEDRPSAAQRPGYSVLDPSKTERAFKIRASPWEVQMEACWRTIGLDQIGSMGR